MKITVTFKDVELDIEFDVVRAEKETGINDHIGWMSIKIGEQDVTDLLDHHSEEIEELVMKHLIFK